MRPQNVDCQIECNFQFPSSGAIKRSSLEKDYPPITYEAFIEELDEGDSFTASMFDLLVKASNGIMHHDAPLMSSRVHSMLRNSRRGVSAITLTANTSYPLKPPRVSVFWPLNPECTWTVIDMCAPPEAASSSRNISPALRTKTLSTKTTTG